MYRKVGNRFALLLDTLALSVCGNGLYIIHTKLILPPQLEAGGHYQFLTNISLVVSLVVFFTGFLSHVLQSSALFKLKNSLHSIALVLETVVTVVYWPLRFFFMNAIISSGEHIPLSLDLSIHLAPAVLLSIDYLFFMPPWTLTNQQALSIISILTVAYWAWLKHTIDVTTGAVYPYPFLNVPEKQRAIIFSGVALIAFSNFLFLKKLYSIVLSKSEVKSAKKQQ